MAYASRKLKHIKHYRYQSISTEENENIIYQQDIKIGINQLNYWISEEFLIKAIGMI